ncbi:MAG: hypothetical protein AABX79_01120 [Nanoarchaeota archaeon]
MILYFDNRISDAQLMPKGFYSELDNIRESDSNYKFQNRLDVTMYSLASHAEIKWSHVIIKYEIVPENKKKQKIFEKFVKKLWPKAMIIHGQSVKIGQYRKISKIINNLKDDWIFYAANNDHPFIAPDVKTLKKCLKKAEKLAQKNKYVSVIYSHFPEPLHMARKGTTIHDIGFPASSILEENDDLIVSEYPNGYFSSMQIANKRLFNYWVDAEIPESAPIWKLEDVHRHIPKKKRPGQILVLAKKELFAHYDGYSHNKGKGYLVPSRLVPPLFIPPGFFANKIKIAYGYDNYRKGWVNINPLKEKFSFEDTKNGTDLKISIKNIPLFWKKRIKKIDINPKADQEKIKDAADERKRKIENFYFTRTWWNFPFYEAYVYQFRMRNLIKRILSTIKPVKEWIKKIEIKYQIKL